MRSHKYDTIIIGGGAAGFFTAINLAERHPQHRIAILERGKEVLSKVRISGGGRCNVTHAEFEPRPLSTNYPRGERELLGPFHTFMTGDTVAWFEDRGVSLKIEEDGRMFPTSDSSGSIIDCFMTLSRKHNIDIHLKTNVKQITKASDFWKCESSEQSFTAKNLVITAGSSPKMWDLLRSMGHTISAAVPSLFTFNLENRETTDLAGIAVEARVEVPMLKLESQGPLLITHWGFSGPAILKLSAWGARELNQAGYKFDLVINWLNHIDSQSCKDLLVSRRNRSKKQVGNDCPFDLPKRLWQYLTDSAEIGIKPWAEISNRDINKLAGLLTACVLKVNGKSTFKEEFVTAGGVELKEIDFRRFGSKLHENLYLAGEVLNIDAITGGFNFQNAWTGGWIIAQSIE
jgi:predicted Rossmann fold flavoprotein